MPPGGRTHPAAAARPPSCCKPPTATPSTKSTVSAIENNHTAAAARPGRCRPHGFARYDAVHHPLVADSRCVNTARLRAPGSRQASAALHTPLPVVPKPVVSRCSKRRRTHSITSSARSRMEVGMVTPRVLALLRFTTSWNWVGRSIGRSAGLRPCSTLPIITPL
jgi:hypothetical protein